MPNTDIPLVSGARSWLQRTRALGPMIDQAAAADEDATELAPEVVEAIDAAGLFAIMAPAELGGGEALARAGLLSV